MTIWSLVVESLGSKTKRWTDKLMEVNSSAGQKPQSAPFIMIERLLMSISNLITSVVITAGVLTLIHCVVPVEKLHRSVHVC